MTKLGDLDDLDLTTIELVDGATLLASWRAGDDGGLWVARDELPAAAVSVEVPWTPNDLLPFPLYAPDSSLQDLVRALLEDGHYVYRRVTDEHPDGPLHARSFHLTDYRRHLPWDRVGGNGGVFGLSYGTADDPASGNVNLTVVAAEIRGSEDPANEIGGCIGSLQLGKGTDPPPTATLWGTCYTLRGSVERQPGGLMAYTAVVQNYFDGSGSRSDNYGYAAVTRPGIGDGHDFHHHDPIRNATTYPVDYGFIVCGDSGPHPQGGEIGYRVGFQAGGGASPWSPREHWRSKIGTGLVVRDWLEAGVHVQPPHPEAGAVPQVRLDRRDDQQGNYLECRSYDGLGLMMAVRPDGRIHAAEGRDPTDVVTVAQLHDALEGLRRELAAAASPAAPAPPTPDEVIAGTSTRRLGRELAHRLSPRRPGFWRSVRRSGRSLLHRPGR